jgi:hypothetical protein
MVVGERRRNCNCCNSSEDEGRVESKERGGGKRLVERERGTLH